VSPESEREIEVALIFSSDDSARELTKLAAERRIGGYLLVPLPPQEILDRYFDTEAGELAGRRIALRVRDAGDGRLLTLKAPGSGREGLSEDRLEIEAPWSPAALERALAELGRRARLRVAPPAMAPEQDPSEVLAACGLFLIQRRTTARQRRSVTRAEASGTAGGIVAELALDDVEYPATGSVVRLREVEIEARGKAGAGEVHDIARRLLERSDGVLRPWPYSKLATGKAIDALVLSPHFLRTLAADASLTPASLAMLERDLATNSSPESPDTVPEDRS
jgi:inorganic triphosphatase YgiF